MLTSGQLLKLRMIPIAIQSRSNRPNSTTPTRIVASNCPLFPKSSALTSFRTSTHPTPRHQQPSATFTLQAPLLPSSHLKEPHPKRPAQAALSSLQPFQLAQAPCNHRQLAFSNSFTWVMMHNTSDSNNLDARSSNMTRQPEISMALWHAPAAASVDYLLLFQTCISFRYLIPKHSHISTT